MAAVVASSFCLVPVEAKPGKGNQGGGGGKPQGKEAKGNPGKGNGGRGNADKKHDEKGGPQAGHKDHEKARGQQQVAPFKDDQRKQVVDYFSDYQRKHHGLPPGLDMNQRLGKPLPPGWEKKLNPGARIDDDIWSSLVPVPNEWFPNLNMEPDTRLYHYGDRIVRVRDSKRELLDVILLNLLK